MYYVMFGGGDGGTLKSLQSAIRKKEFIGRGTMPTGIFYSKES